jgi:arsenate reductase-like glutaredoxin family protein
MACPTLSQNYQGVKTGIPEDDRSTRDRIVNKLAHDFHNETGGWFFSLRSNTIKQCSCKDVLIRVENYLMDATVSSLLEKRLTIPEGKAVIKKKGVMKLVKKREGGGERLTIDDSMKADLLNEKEVTIAELEKRKEKNEEVTALLAKTRLVETERLVKGKKLRVEDLKVLIQVRGVKPISQKKSALIEQWKQVAFDYYEIEVPEDKRRRQRTTKVAHP